MYAGKAVKKWSGLVWKRTTRRTIRVTKEDYELEPGKARVKERSQTPSKKDERASE